MCRDPAAGRRRELYLVNSMFADRDHCADVREGLEIADAMDVAGAFEQHNFIEPMAV